MHRLILFTRYPRPGACKTRLIPVLGAEGAAELQRRLTERLLERLAPLLEEPSISLELRYTPDHEGPAMERWIRGEDGRRAAVPAIASAKNTRAGRVLLAPQGPGDLGQRMHRAIAAALQEGAASALVLGTDVPGLTASLAREAIEALTTRELVLGPAADGGYYLIGLTRPCSALFEGVPWGQDTVMEATLERARKAGLDVALLPPLSDIDRPEDLTSLS